MNKMLTFFTAPITAFFYPPVYQDAAKSSAGRGVLYCLYLAGIATVLLGIFFSVRVMPKADAFIEWTQSSLPVLIWTPAGLSLEDGKTSAELTHPKYGKIALFDMTKTAATEADFGGAYVLVTSTKVFMRQAQGRIETRDITGAGMRSNQQLPARVRLDGAIVGKIYQNVKGMMVGTVVFLILLFSFPFLLVTNLFYSLAGLLLNLMRKEKIRYGAIWNLTCFATSTTFTLVFLAALGSSQATIFPPVLIFLGNLAFMFFAFKVTDKKKEAV